MQATSASLPPAYSRRRFKFGVFLFVCGRLTFLLIPLVRSSSLDKGWKDVLSVLCVFGLPDLFTVLAAAVLGKQGFTRLKELLFGLLHRLAPPARVSKLRYRVGLVMFFLPIAIGWAYPYLDEILPAIAQYRLGLSIGGDVMFVASFLVLGGDFWDKLGNLFTHKSVASGTASGNGRRG